MARSDNSAQRPQRSLFRRAGVVLVGTSVGQLALIGASPLLSRIYAPEHFGFFGSYLSVLALCLVGASWRYNLAVVIPERQEDARCVVWVSILATLISAAALTAVMWALGESIARVASVELGVGYWFLPVAVVVSGTQLILVSWATRAGQYSALATGRASDGLLKALAQVSTGAAGLLRSGLFIGDFIGRCAGLLVLARASESIGWPPPVRKLLEAARRFRRFALLGAPAAAMNAASLNAPVLLIGFTYGMKEAGWFALAQRVVATPTGFLGQALAQVYLGEGSRLARESPRTLLSLFHKTSLKLFAFSVVPAIILLAWAPSLFEFGFGSDWGEAGWYARLAAAMFVCQFTVSPFSQTLNILERQGMQLAWDAARLVSVVASLVGPALMGWPARHAVVAYACTMSLFYLVLWLLGRRAIASRVRTDELSDGSRS